MATYTIHPIGSYNQMMGVYPSGYDYNVVSDNDNNTYVFFNNDNSLSYNGVEEFYWNWNQSASSISNVTFYYTFKDLTTPLSAVRFSMFGSGYGGYQNPTAGYWSTLAFSFDINPRTGLAWTNNDLVTLAAGFYAQINDYGELDCSEMTATVTYVAGTPPTNVTVTATKGTATTSVKTPIVSTVRNNTTIATVGAATVQITTPIVSAVMNTTIVATVGAATAPVKTPIVSTVINITIAAGVAAGASASIKTHTVLPSINITNVATVGAASIPSKTHNILTGVNILVTVAAGSVPVKTPIVNVAINTTIIATVGAASIPIKTPIINTVCNATIVGQVATATVPVKSPNVSITMIISDLILNGDFNQGGTNWSGSAGFISFANYRAEIDTTNATDWKYISQWVTGKGDTSYTLQFDKCTANGTVFLEQYDSSWSLLDGGLGGGAYVNIGELNGVGTVSFTFKSLPNTKYMYIYLSNKNSCNVGTIAFDNVSFGESSGISIQVNATVGAATTNNKTPIISTSSTIVGAASTASIPTKTHNIIIDDINSITAGAASIPIKTHTVSITPIIVATVGNASAPTKTHIIATTMNVNNVVTVATAINTNKTPIILPVRNISIVGTVGASTTGTKNHSIVAIRQINAIVNALGALINTKAPNVNTELYLIIDVNITENNLGADIKENNVAANVMENNISLLILEKNIEVVIMAFQGDTIKLQVQFRDYKGVLFDPTTITFKTYQNTNQLLDTQNVPIGEKISTGIYEHPYTVPLGSGSLVYEFTGMVGTTPSIIRGKIPREWVR